MADRSSKRRSPLVGIAVLAAVYVAAAKLGLALSVAHGNVTPVWAPTGISLAALLFFGMRLWPGVALGAFIVNVTTPIPVWAAGAICVGNTLEAVVGTTLLKRFANFDTALERVRDVLNLVLYGAVIATAISATVGATALYIADEIDHYGFSWQLWWHGDAMGALLVTPLLLAWGTAIRRRRGSPAPLEEALLMMLTGVMSYFVFFGSVWRYPYVLFPLLVWAALRFRQRGAASAVLIVSVFAVSGIVSDSLPIGGITKTAGVEVFQTLMAIVAITSLVLAADLTEREEGQGHLERSLSLLRATLDSTTDGILVVDPEGRISSFNQRFVDMWNLPGELVESGDDDLAQAAVLEQLVDPDGFLERIRELYSQPEAESYDYIEFKDGRIFERFSQPQRQAGAPVGRVWSFRDVTERRRLEDARQRFISDAVHELRSPIAVLTGMAELLNTRKAQLSEDDISNILDKMGKQGSRLNRLVARMLDLGRIEARAREADLVPVDIEEAVKDVLEVNPAPEDKTVRLEVESDHKAMADAQSLEQVLINLLGNAYRYGGDQIVILTSQSGERVSVAVFDNGAGIDAAMVPHLFEPFHRGSTHRDVEGYGLGLAIVRTLTRAMGGDVDYDWIEGRGACFSVTLPAASPAD